MDDLKLQDLAAWVTEAGLAGGSETGLLAGFASALPRPCGTPGPRLVAVGRCARRGVKQPRELLTLDRS